MCDFARQYNQTIKIGIHICSTYHQSSNISCSLVDIDIIDHSTPVGASATTFSF